MSNIEQRTHVEPIDAVALLLRIWLGAVMLAHGIRHARTLGGTAAWFASKGFRQPKMNAQASALGEITIGAGLVLGLLTPFAAAGLVATMTVAYGSIHRFAGFFVFSRPDEGWEYVATLAVAAIAVATIGPGPASVDAGIGIGIAGWAGFAVAAGGIAVGIAQLAAFWRPTQEGS